MANDPGLPRGGPPDVFVYPPWLFFAVPLLTVAVATLAAVYPARRAARMSPVDAVRHEG